MLTIYFLIPIFITIFLFNKNNNNNVKNNNKSRCDYDSNLKNTIVISNKYINKNIIDIDQEIQFIRWYENVNINIPSDICNNVFDISNSYNRLAPGI